MTQEDSLIPSSTDINSLSSGLTFGIGTSEPSSGVLTQQPEPDRSSDANVTTLTAMKRGTGTPGEGDKAPGDLPGDIVDTVA